MPTRIFSTILALACLCTATPAGETQPDVPQAPFFRAREHPTEYAGPGRELPAPADVQEVLIGYFGPSDPSDPESGDMWRAARLAVEAANAEGGYQGKPFRLVAAWSENPWGTGVAQVARMVYQDGVWAIVGGVDGPSTHLAEQVVAKARLPLVSPASTDKTVNLANVPWMFSCLPGDHLQAPPLAAEISMRVGGQPLVLVSADDHDSHLFAVELLKRLAERRIVPRYHFQSRQPALSSAELVSRIVESKPMGVVVVAGALPSARLVAALREKGFAGPVFGGPWMGRGRFREEAGVAAEGAVFPLAYDPHEESQRLAKGFQARFGKAPDYAAASTYDAVRLVIAAVRKAGLNRARIGDAVKELSPWSGATGKIEWDPLGSNTRPVRLGTIRDGRVVAVDGSGQ